MTAPWQEINEERPFCHWWRFLDGARLTAMTTILLIIVAIAVALLLVEVVREVRHDGPSGHEPPRSHGTDPRFRSPAAWG